MSQNDALVLIPILILAGLVVTHPKQFAKLLAVLAVTFIVFGIWTLTNSMQL